MLNTYLPTKASKKRCFLLVILMSSIYLLDNPTISALFGSQVFRTIIKPALWLGLAGIIWSFPKLLPESKLKHREFLNWWAFIFAVIFIVISVITGLFFDGLGKSPYDHSLQGIAINIWVIFSMLIGRELIRNFLINNFTTKENYFVYILIALLMTVSAIPLSKFMGLAGYEESVKFIAQFFAPEFSKNFYATYIAFLGGPIPAIIYMGTLQAFHWLSPILPNLKWITTALIGVLVPVFSLSIVQNMYLTEARLLKKSQVDNEGPLGWILTSLISIAIVWFAVGVFSIYPSVVATGSMEPMIKPGDVILVKKAATIEDINKLKEGDVIQFQRDSILISHRIIEIVQEDKKLQSYRTKGDNNTGADIDMLQPEQIKGEVVNVIPKIGWPTLLIKSDKESP